MTFLKKDTSSFKSTNLSENKMFSNAWCGVSFRNWQKGYEKKYKWWANFVYLLMNQELLWGAVKADCTRGKVAPCEPTLLLYFLLPFCLKWMGHIPPKRKQKQGTISMPHLNTARMHELIINGCECSTVWCCGLGVMLHCLAKCRPVWWETLIALVHLACRSCLV